MHLQCALQMINKEAKCSYCSRSVNKESLSALSKKVDLMNSHLGEEKTESDDEGPSTTIWPDTSGDEEYARFLQEKLNQNNSSSDPQTEFDAILAEGLKNEEQRNQRIQNNAPPSPETVAWTQGRRTCNDFTKTAAAVTFVAFTVGMLVQAVYGELS